jgi:hypothetical protein
MSVQVPCTKLCEAGGSHISSTPRYQLPERGIWPSARNAEREGQRMCSFSLSPCPIVLLDPFQDGIGIIER